MFLEQSLDIVGFQIDTNRENIAACVSGIILDPRMGAGKRLVTLTASVLTALDGFSSSGKVQNNPSGKSHTPSVPQKSQQNKKRIAADQVYGSDFS